MPTVSTKRQITLPADKCREVGFESGDECRIVVVDDFIVIVPRKPGIARGILKDLKVDHSISDDESLQAAIEEDRKRIDSQ